MLLKISFLLFLLCSCLSENKNARELELILKEKFWEARSVEFKEDKVFFNKEIKDPPFTWRLLLVIDKRNCLFYRTPLGNEAGILRLVLETERDCFEQSYDQNITAELMGINQLSFEKLGKRESYLQRERDYQIKGRLDSIDFSWHMIAPQVEETLQANKRPELLVSSAIFQHGGVKEWVKDLSLMGSWEQRYSDGDFHFCHRVNKDCQDTVEFTCEQCRFGWVEVIDHFCPQGGSKICGRDRCGERGEPACLRGRSFLEENVDGPCFADSLAGFCGANLNTVCDENGVLICL